MIERMETDTAVSRRSLLLLGGALLASPLLAEGSLHFSAKTLDGEKVTSDSLKGKVVLIEFWATWCPYCKREQPVVDQLSQEFNKDGLVVLAVDMGEPKRKVKKFLEDNPRAVKIVLADDTTLAAICDATSYPLYVVLNRDGEIAGRQQGAAGESALRRLLRRAGMGEES